MQIPVWVQLVPFLTVLFYSYLNKCLFCSAQCITLYTITQWNGNSFFLFYSLTCLENWEKLVFSIDPCITRMWYSAKVSSHQQEAWGGRTSWKVQHQHTEKQQSCTCSYTPLRVERLMACAQNQEGHRLEQMTVREHILWLSVSQRHGFIQNKCKSNLAFYP